MEPMNAYDRLRSFREDIRQHLSVILANTSEENPLNCDIILGENSPQAVVSTLMLPHVVSMYRNQETDEIYFLMDYNDGDWDFAPDFDMMWMEDLVDIIDVLEK